MGTPVRHLTASGHVIALVMKFAILLALLPAALCFDCSQVQDGVYEAGCKSFTVCANGVASIKECAQDQVFDANTGTCADEASVGAGLYADTDQQCTSYYTCSGGTYFGHNYCAGGLVFNEALQTCDWPDDTDPPCGTKGSARPTNAPGSG